MERLSRQVQETNKLISDPLTDWQDITSTTDELATAVESVGGSVSHKDIVRQLLTLSVSINTHLGSHRSKLLRDVCEHLERIVKVTGLDFQDMANALLPQIINTAKSSSGAIRQPGSKLLALISKLVRYDLSLMRKMYLQLLQEKARVLMLEQLGIIFVYWDDDEVQMWDADVLGIMRQGLEDQNDKVRKTAREVLTKFTSRWSERVDELMEMPSNQSKALLISEHQTSPLAQAILKKYPDLASKSDSFSRSRSSFTSSRSSFRKSPRHKREQDVEIHVSATPPRKQREGRSSSIQETTGTEVGSRSTTRQSVAAPERTECETSAVSRRLFKDPDFSDGNDNDQQDDGVLGSFDGSQMHGFQSKVSTSKTMQLAPEISDVSCPAPAISSRDIVERSSSVTTAEEALLRHPGVRKLQESKIPSPLTRSPSLPSKKRPGSPARSTSSPGILPSLLPRPGSFTLKSRGSSGPSTPKGSAKFDDEMETNPLSASDAYFSKPIPSSVATPTPPPQSTDNVTLRPKRRGFVHQEPEDSFLDSHSPELSSPKLPVPQTLSRSRQVEATPESNVYSRRFDEETASPVAGKHYGDSSIENSDDIGHTTENSGHLESAYDHRRLNDCHSRSDSSSLEDTHQTHADIGGGGDDLNNWRLDDGPRHKFDFEDEIGDRLSDEDLGQSEFVVGEEDAHRTSIDKSDNLETEHESVGFSLEEHFTQHLDYDKATEYEKQSAELNLESTPNDALTGLLEVRDEMTRLRAITKNEGNSYDVELREHRDLSTHYTLDTAEAHEELQDPSPISCYEGQPRGGSSFLQRLTDADRLARSPLMPPPGESLNEEEEFTDRPFPLQTYERSLHPVGDDDMYHDEENHEEREQSEESDLLNQQAPSTSALPVFEQATTIDDAQRRKPVEHSSPRVESSAGPRAVHSQEPYTAHHDQAGRFDAAEKLFAAKGVSRVHDYYVDPQLPKRELVGPYLLEQEHYRHLEPSRELYPAPTSMGANLATALSSAQRHAAAEPNASQEEASESVAEVGNEEEDAPQEQIAERSVPHQPKASFAETTPCSPQTENNLAAERSSRFASFAMLSVVFLAAIFCIAGIMHAAKKVNESHEYHLDLKARIGKFEASIADSHQKVLKLEKDYAIWSEYVRKLTEEEEANALTQLQAIQVEVQKWQQDMKEDLVQFRQALSVDSIEAAFANVLDNTTKEPAE